MPTLLVGEIHFDPFKYDRVSKVLQWWQPDTISVEQDQEEFLNDLAVCTMLIQDSYFQKDFQKRFPHLDPKTAQAIVHGVYLGSLAILEYMQQQDKAVELAFAEDESAWELVRKDYSAQAVQKYLSTLATMTMPEFTAFVEEEYQPRMCEVPSKLAEQYQTRDIFATEVTSQGKGRVVHFGGLDHLVGAYYNLFDRLPHAQRMKLSEADSLKFNQD